MKIKNNILVDKETNSYSEGGHRMTHFLIQVGVYAKFTIF